MSIIHENQGVIFSNAVLINILQFTEVFHLHVNSTSKLSISLIVLSVRPVGGKYELFCGIVLKKIFFTH